MCTVTFLPDDTGFSLGMNRDEKRDRVLGLPPMIVAERGTRWIMPSEPGGGTWIGVQEAGAALALINWYSVPRRVTGSSRSRGHVLRRLLAESAPSGVEETLRGLDLQCVNPFRIVGVFPGSRQVMEWRWDLECLTARGQGWGEPLTWISSGYDERGADRERRSEFESHRGRVTAVGVRDSDWLHALHAGHGKERGAYSHCMHRDDAVTVSYTEVRVGRDRVEMGYRPGSPCEGRSEVNVAMIRVRGEELPREARVMAENNLRMAVMNEGSAEAAG